MNIAEGVALVLLCAIYYPIVAPILTVFVMIDTILAGGTMSRFGYIWSIPFLVIKGEFSDRK